MAEMHEWDEPGFWVKKKPAKDNMKLTHVSVPIKELEEVISSMMWMERRIPEPYQRLQVMLTIQEVIKKLQTYLPED